MRTVFMGTPTFATYSLSALADAHEVACVYTRPDAVMRRGNTPEPSPVKVEALARGLRVRETAGLRDPALVTELRSLKPDVVVVAAYGAILPRNILEVPVLGCINVHASLLPRWRGAAPIQHAILAGDTITGVTIMRMEEGLDTGPYCASARVSVGEKGAQELTDELGALGADLLVATLPSIATRKCVWAAQDEEAVTYAPKITKGDVALAPELEVADFTRRVRASTSSARSRISIAGRAATVLSARPVPSAILAPGGVAAGVHGLVVGCADGSVALELVRPDGKQTMDGHAWSHGLRIDDRSTWSGAS